MKYRILLLFLLWSTFGFSQQIAIKELLQEAEPRYWDNPEHSIRIAGYILNQQENIEISAQANLILGKSYFVQSKVYEAIRATLQARDLTIKIQNPPLQIDIALFNLELLKQLSLTTVSDDLKVEIDLLKNELPSSRHIENQILLLEAETALAQDDLITSEEYFNAISSNVNASDSIQSFRIALGQARLKFKQGAIEKSREILERIPPGAPKFFQVLKLNLLAEIHFNNNEFTRAVSKWTQAKDLAKELPNDELANQSIKGLIEVYLIREDSKRYLNYKQEANLLSANLITNRVQAVNFTYNYYEDLEQQLAQRRLAHTKKNIYLMSGGFVFLIVMVLGLNYYYRLRKKEYAVFRKLISPSPADTKKETPNKILVSEETEKQLLIGLKEFETGTDYTRSDMSISFLAARLNTNNKYLSDVIKRHKAKNFNGYINELRINYIIEKLKTEPVYLNYKISYLAEESGFSSHSSFTTVFKSVTGISPTKFLDLLQKEGNYET